MPTKRKSSSGRSIEYKLDDGTKKKVKRVSTMYKHVKSGLLKKTRGGIKKSDLYETASGKLVSRKRHSNGKKALWPKAWARALKKHEIDYFVPCKKTGKYAFLYKTAKKELAKLKKRR